jgi:O-antigen ligase/Tfp pilus assembly protein PilF
VASVNPEWQWWPAAALPPVAVLALDPGGLSPFGPVKWALVPTLVLGAWAASTWLGGRAQPRVPRPLALAGIGFLAVVALAAGAGLDPLYAWTGTPERHFGALTWLLCAVAFVVGHRLDRVGVRLVLAGATAAVGVLGAWSGAEALGWRPLHLVGAGTRPVGTLGSSAYLGAAAVLLAPVALGWWAGRRRWWAGVAGASGAVAVVVSGARAAWVGGVIALVAWGWARRPAGRVVAAAAGAVVVAVGLAVASGVAGRVPDAVQDRDGGARGRLDEWRVAARVVAKHPLAGTGPEGYRIAFGAAVDDRYEMAHGRNPLPDRAHDALLDVAATTGVFGLASYVVVLLLVGRYVVRALRRSPPWVAGAAAGLLAYAVQSVFLFPVAELEPVAWLLAGMVVRAVAAGDGDAVVRARPRPVAAGVACVVAVGVLAAGVLDVAADRRARALLAHGASALPSHLRPDALRYHLVEARAAEDAGRLDAAIAAVDDGLDVSGRDPVARSERARLLLEQARATRAPADVAAARAALERVAHDDPRNAEVALRLGVARALAGDEAGAERAWRKAERLAPRSPAASVNLAVAYARAGQRDKARAAARVALDRDPSNRRAAEILETSDGT